MVKASSPHEMIKDRSLVLYFLRIGLYGLDSVFTSIRFWFMD